jgi:hypothetical protein
MRKLIHFRPAPHLVRHRRKADPLSAMQEGCSILKFNSFLMLINDRIDHFRKQESKGGYSIYRIQELLRFNHTGFIPFEIRNIHFLH